MATHHAGRPTQLDMVHARAHAQHSAPGADAAGGGGSGLGQLRISRRTPKRLKDCWPTKMPAPPSTSAR
jgi:hypothetical protein